MFCEPETVDVDVDETSTAEGLQNIQHSAFPRSQSIFIIYQESKKRKNRANFVRKYMKYFIDFLKNFIMY